MSVPCGQCMGCRIAKTNDWATRIMHESQMHDTNCFVTLTYNDENYPERGSLDKDHLRTFIKALRDYLKPQRIRYFASGEYGDCLKRPHYHLIIFNYWPHDTTVLEDTEYGALYKSEKLASIWKKGFVTVGSVQYESAAYTAKYITKKVTGQLAHDYYHNRLPEFASMSLRPGIGYAWLEKYKQQTKVCENVVVRGRERSLPQYYKKKFKETDIDFWFDLKWAAGRFPRYNEKRLGEIDKYLNDKVHTFSVTK